MYENPFIVYFNVVSMCSGHFPRKKSPEKIDSSRAFSYMVTVARLNATSGAPSSALMISACRICLRKRQRRLLMTYAIVEGVSQFGGVDFRPYPLALRFKGQGTRGRAKG